MKTSGKKGFGIIGINVELSFIELMLIREQLNIINESNLLDMQYATSDKVALLNMIAFCEKLLYSDLEEEMNKAGELLFSNSKSAMPLSADDEDLKNECDLNALENETHQ